MSGVDIIAKMRTDTKASLLRSIALEGGIAAAEWRNANDDEATLRQTDGHIFSLYLEGGETTRRVDQASSFGGPGKLCFLPRGHSSVWDVRGAMRFIHLYFDADALAASIAHALDADIRDVEARELVYVQDPAAEAAMRRLAATDWREPADKILATTHTHAIAEANVRRWFGVSRSLHGGGLAPRARRRVMEHVEASLDAPITLGALAAVAGVSTWHFAKAFKESAGLAPYRYVKARRMALALRLLRDGREPITEIAARCGYASPTRFSTEVKAAFGAAPAMIRRAHRTVSAA